MTTQEELGRRITFEEWEQFPAKPPKAPDKYASIMDEVEQGGLYVLPFLDNKDLRGKRIGLGRRASQRKFKLEIRIKGNEMAIRRSDSAYTPPVKSEEPKARTPRRRGSAAESEEA